MRRSFARGLLLCLVSAGLVGLGACAQETPEERIARLRADYDVTLNSFVMDQVPVEEEVMGEGEMAAEGEMEGDGGLEGEMEAEPEGQPGTEEGTEGMEEEDILEPVLQQDVLLDILVKNNSQGTLPVLTLEVSQVDAEGYEDLSQALEKAHYRIEIDTSRLIKGASEQILHRLEDVDFEEGDAWAVEVRHPVPPEDRSEYREFSAGEGG